MTDSMTHEPDTSRPLPGVTPEQRLIDLAGAHLVACTAYVKSNGTMQAVDESAEALAKASDTYTIKALAEVVRAAREDVEIYASTNALRRAIAALDSQEEQQS